MEHQGARDALICREAPLNLDEPSTFPGVLGPRMYLGSCGTGFENRVPLPLGQGSGDGGAQQFWEMRGPKVAGILGETAAGGNGKEVGGWGKEEAGVLMAPLQ